MRYDAEALKKMEKAFSMEALRNGDEKAFGQLCDMYTPMLTAYAQKFSYGTCHEPGDFIQEAMLVIWQRRQQFDEIYQLKSYLFKALHSQCVNAYRIEKRKNTGLPGLEDHLLRNQPHQPDKILQGRETLQKVRKQAEQLSVNQQQLFDLCCMGITDGHTLADLMEEKPTTIRGITRYMRLNLAEKIEDKTYGQHYRQSPQ